MRDTKVARIALILLIVGLVGVLAVLIVNLVPLVARSSAYGTAAPPPAPPGLATSETPLVEAEALAGARAREWAPDAALVRADGSWNAPQGASGIEAPTIAWTFSYYSATKGQLASVGVDDSDLLWVPPREIPIVPTSLAAFPPEFGSDVAWVSFLGAGGDVHLESRPNTVVHFSLQPKDRMPVWVVSARSDTTTTSITMDADTGTVRVE